MHWSYKSNHNIRDIKKGQPMVDLFYFYAKRDYSSQRILSWIGVRAGSLASALW